MKEKISQLAKEKFEYVKPELLFSVERLMLSVEVPKTAKETVRITNTLRRPMKGVVYSSDERLTIEHNTFVGEEADITVVYDAAGEDFTVAKKEAVITVVSNYGVFELPVVIQLEAPYVDTSYEKIRDLYQFAALAKKDWNEALTIFKSAEFRQLIVTRPADRRVYDGLLESPVLSQAMEEFLVATHTKLEVALSFAEKEKMYEEVHASIQDEIEVKASEWGYVDAAVTTDSDLIQLKKQTLESSDFEDGIAKIPFTISYTNLLCREQKGTITVATTSQEITFTVHATKANIHKQRVKESPLFLRSKYEAKLVETYIQFRLNHLTKEAYEEQLESTINQLIQVYPSMEGNLWKAHLYMLTGEKEKLDRMMAMFAENEQELLAESLDYYLAYRYLDVLYQKDEEQIEETVELFHSYLETQTKDFRLLWYLLYIDPAYEKNTGKRLAAILAMLRNGVTSPVLYYEAAFAYNKEPQLLTELGREERQIMHWAVRYRLISRELANQFVFAASRVKKFDRLLLQDLMVVYEYRESAECLQIILRMLISGRKTDSCYFKWYERGVKQNLKITELYEYYMYSIKEEEQAEIDNTVLLYFVYNNHLPEAKKAFLYAYILKHKEEIGSIYRTYLRQMESFARKMALKGNLSASLAVLYEEFITPETIDEELAKALPQILFRYEFLCENKKITSVSVRQQELKEESLLAVDDGRCFLTMATSDATIFLLDTKKNRYIGTGTYTLKRLFYKEELVRRCYELNQENLLLLIFQRARLSNSRQGSRQAEACCDITRRLIESGEISDEFKADHYVSMLEQYYDQGDYKKLEECLQQIEPSCIPREDRKTVTEYLIMQKQYDKAYRMVTLYGYEYIGKKRLLELVTYLLGTHMAVEPSSAANRYFLSMCDNLYRRGVTDETILLYLSTHYENTTKEMYKRYMELEKAGIDTLVLQERLLGQMLFSEDGLSESKSIFIKFYKQSNNKMLIRAYLNYMAYRYVRFDEEIDEALCEMMKRESFYHESRVSMLALLKFYKDKPVLNEEEYKLIDYNLHRFIKEGIILPFFKEYEDRIQLPNTVTDRTYVEYKGSPEHQVKITYAVSGTEQMEEAEMKNVFEGIFVKDFLLFYGEELRYYITEQEAGSEQVTEPKTLTRPSVEKEAENRFDELNIMLQTLEQKDNETLQELLRQYAIEDYITSSLFTPL